MISLLTGERHDLAGLRLSSKELAGVRARADSDAKLRSPKRDPSLVVRVQSTKKTKPHAMPVVAFAPAYRAVLVAAQHRGEDAARRARADWDRDEPARRAAGHAEMWDRTLAKLT